MNPGFNNAILVVEDEVLVRLDLIDVLESSGYLVRQARDADEAIDVLDTDQSIRAIFIDIIMPGTMDGIELAHVVHQRWPSVAIVISSGNINSDTRARPPGVFLLHKPYALRELRLVLSELSKVASE